MTDNDIIKAFEEYLQKCQNIKYGARKKILVDSDFLNNVLDLINRKDAEIERLTTELVGMRGAANSYKMHYEKRKAEVTLLNLKIKEQKSETIKEFWSKLKTHTRKMKSSDFSGEFWDKAILVEDGDNLVKEMVGEE